MDFPPYMTGSGGTTLPIRTRPHTPTDVRHGTPSPTDSGPPSPIDSGYDSAHTTPRKRPSSTGSDDYEARALYTLDGADNDYYDEPVSDKKKLPRTVVSTPEQKEQEQAEKEHQPRSARQTEKRFFSKPLVRKPRKTIPLPQDANNIDVIAHRQARNTLLGPYLCKSRASFSLSSLRRADRFVHPRDPFPLHLTLRDRHRLSKDIHKLAKIEKAFRSNAVSRDPFAEYPTGMSCPMSTGANYRQRELHRLGQPTQTRARTTLGAMPETYSVEYTPIVGSVWASSSLPPVAGVVDNGMGRFVHSRTGEPVFMSEFLTSQASPTRDDNKHRGRMCTAMGHDRAARLLQCTLPSEAQPRVLPHHPLRATPKTVWDGVTWVNDAIESKASKKKVVAVKKTPQRQLRLIRQISAPLIRNDFYITPMTFCPRTGTMAVALENSLYTWTQDTQVGTHINGNNHSKTYLTALAYSCAEGGNSILAFGRSNGLFGLMALSDGNHAHMVVNEGLSISQVSWRPKCTMRPSKHPKHKKRLVPTEDLLVGTEAGILMYYIIEWPSEEQVEEDGWGGDITLAARIVINKQHICGIAWSPDCEYFAVGSNDNCCSLFSVKDVFAARMYSTGDLKPMSVDDILNGTITMSQLAKAAEAEKAEAARKAAEAVVMPPRPAGSSENSPIAAAHILGQDFVAAASGRAAEASEAELAEAAEAIEKANALSSKYSVARLISPGDEHCRWEQGGAVKSIAFCPWQDGLLATGGGLYDQCIHFYHMSTGSSLATIYVGAQVTGLMWSRTRHEIAATFGYAQHGHNIHVAVYSWPECTQVATIEWQVGVRCISSVPCVPFWPGLSRCSRTKAKRTGRQIRTPHPDDIVIDDSDEGEGIYDANNVNDADTANDAGQAKGPARARRRRVRAHPKDTEEVEDLELHEGVIAVASTAETINFYEVWPGDGPSAVGKFAGIFGGSDILEDIGGVIKEGDVLR